MFQAIWEGKRKGLDGALQVCYFPPHFRQPKPLFWAFPMPRALLLLTLVLCCAGCDTARYLMAGDSAIRLQSDTDAMKAELLQRIPTGAPAGTAEKVLEANGFTCRGAEIDPDNPNRSSEHYSIFASREFVFIHYIDVDLVYELGLLKDINVRRSTEGP